MSTFETKIQQYMDAGFPIIYLHTFEAEKAKSAIKSAAGNSEAILVWDGTDRVLNIQGDNPAVNYEMIRLPDFLDDRMDMLLWDKRQIIVLQSIETFVDDPAVIARLSKIAGCIYNGLDATVFVLSPVLNIPGEIEKYVTVLEMDYLSTEEIEDVIQKFADEQEVAIRAELKHQMAGAFKGLTELEITNILQLAFSESGDLTSSKTKLIFEQKSQMIKKAGILEMVRLKEDLGDIGGLDNLKSWLQRKKKVFADLDRAQAFGVDMPKGVLIAGIPGCGKSLSAKATAKLFEVPLLRLDMGRLLGKYVGESEANMRKAIGLAEAISPCVLWVDELEKAFAGIGGEGSGAEVTTRLFGSFLTWLQEKESPVFVVATANDITKLPPELLRKGRFDEIFYVSLPSDEERQKIFEIHIAKRRKADLPAIKKEMGAILNKTKGYSGADIEGVVREGVEYAFADNKSCLEAADIIRAIGNTHSLSEIMKEPIEKMKKEYEDRKFKNASR